MNPVELPVKPGDVVAGKYRIERILGQGGMGVVVAATHLDLLEPRALKFMLQTALTDAETVERFLREARAAARLKSEHVARVHDVGRSADGTPYIVMEYLEGMDMSAKLRREGARPIEEGILYILQACEALAEAHAAGIIHRDLKPGNLFITQRPDGTPSIKVLDFGISKITGADANDMDVTKTHTVLGSPLYMSPEQMHSSRDVDGRSDIWSLGVILYALLTGQLPYRGKSLTEMVAAVFTTSPTPPSKVAPHVPPGLEAVVLRCLERDREARFSNIGELALALRPYTPPFAIFLVDRILRLSGAGRQAMPSYAGIAPEGQPGFGSAGISGLTPAPAPSHPSGITPPPGAYSYASTPHPSSPSASSPSLMTGAGGAPFGGQGYGAPPQPPSSRPGTLPMPMPPPSNPAAVTPYGGGQPRVPPPPPSSPSAAAYGAPTPFPSSPSGVNPYGAQAQVPPPFPSSPSAVTPYGAQPHQLPAAMSASGAWGTTAAGMLPRRSRAPLIIGGVLGTIFVVIVSISVFSGGPKTAAAPEATSVAPPIAAPPIVSAPETAATAAPPATAAAPTASAEAPSASASAGSPEAPSASPSQPKKPPPRRDPFGMDRK